MPGHQVAKVHTVPKTGQAVEYTDAETGFQYLRNRYYDPATAQFLNRDPREDESGQPYAYANNSPHNFTDSSREIAFAVIAAAWAAFEVGSAVVDAFSTARILTDPCASGLEKFISGGLFAVGAVMPGGGYSTGARAAHNNGKQRRQRRRTRERAPEHEDDLSVPTLRRQWELPQDRDTSNPGGKDTQKFLLHKPLDFLTSGSRSDMLNLERFIVERDSGPWNF